LKRVRLDEVREGPSDAGARWLPLRAALGLQSFGVSAYRGDPGEVVVPEHRELGEGAGNHQELYVVMRGSARFEVENDSFDAPAVTFVLVERGERRRAEATEPDTLVLAAGAPVGEPYRVAPWEYGSRAAYARSLGDIDELERVVHEGTSTYGDHVTMQIGRACVAAQRGRIDDARAELEREYADPDFGDWARAQAAAEPLLAPARGDA
jgi:quercetin dioxygenase-like cupin family protein